MTPLITACLTCSVDHTAVYICSSFNNLIFGTVLITQTFAYTFLLTYSVDQESKSADEAVHFGDSGRFFSETNF